MCTVYSRRLKKKFFYLRVAFLSVLPAENYINMMDLSTFFRLLRRLEYSVHPTYIAIANWDFFVLLFPDRFSLASCPWLNRHDKKVIRHTWRIFVDEFHISIIMIICKNGRNARSYYIYCVYNENDSKTRDGRFLSYSL